jgi:uncharacterized protein YndB with AHSA1/START domain
MKVPVQSKTVRVAAGWCTVLAAAGLGLATVADAGHRELPTGGFAIEHELVLPGAPETIYDAITGDISEWWDHSFTETPKAFYIEARPGGGFWEIFDESGDGALHATVIYAERGKLLRFDGPLGLSGKAVKMVHTYEFAHAGTDSTRLKLTVHATGEIDEGLAEAVDNVWFHFLVERFKPYVESGRHLRRGGGGGREEQK